MAISEIFLQELKNNSDIEQLVSSYVHLKRRGRIASGLCPFHSEKSPSFTVYPENQTFYCFGCGAGGDVITFVRRIENLTYVEAVKFLAQRAGMRMPEEADDGASRLKTRILALNRALARFYHDCLRGAQGKAGLDYLHGRALQNKTITRFGLGYAPGGGAAARFLRGQGFTEEEMLSAGAAGKSREGGRLYDTFRERVIFPIIDLRGNVVGFGGRAMGDKGPKYLNSSDTPAFKKSRNLFAFNFAKSTKRQGLILCEGYMDVIAMHQAGFDNAVATLGTALTGEQARLISQYTDTVTLSYDSDGPGQAATRRAVGLLGETGTKIRVLTMSGAKDPDEYIKKFGPDKFALLIDRAANSTEYEITRLRQQYDLDQPDGKVAFMKGFVGLMLEVQNPIERDVYMTKICTELGVQKDAVKSQLEYEQKRRSKRKTRDTEELKVYSEVKRSGETFHAVDPQRARFIRYALAEDKLLGILLKNPDYYKRAAGRITPADFVTDRNRELAEILFPRLEEGRSVEPALLSGICSVEQMGLLVQLLESARGVLYAPEDMDPFIDVILGFKHEKTQEEVARMPKEDLVAYVAELSKNKK